MKMWNRVKLGAVGLGMSGIASAAVPTEATNMMTELGTDAATVLAAGYALLAISFAGVWLMGYIKKVGNRAK